jgi:hypothetical protein
MSNLTLIGPQIGKMIPRLASEYDGEVVATVRAIERTLKAAGRDWHDLAKALDPPLAPSDWRSLARYCANRQRLLSARELDFIVGISRLPRITEKQAKWLGDIASRLRAAA